MAKPIPANAPNPPITSDGPPDPDPPPAPVVISSLPKIGRKKEVQCYATSSDSLFNSIIPSKKLCV